MATLYKRANPSQRRILRIIEGAVKNAADAHPDHRVSDRFARSVAKRAAGTLTAQWPEVLAATVPSVSADGHNSVMAPPSSAKLSKQAKRGAVTRVNRTPPSSFNKIYKRLGLMAGWARKAGHESRASAFADALRVVAAVEEEETYEKAKKDGPLSGVQTEVGSSLYRP